MSVTSLSGTLKTLRPDVAAHSQLLTYLALVSEVTCKSRQEHAVRRNAPFPSQIPFHSPCLASSPCVAALTLTLRLSLRCSRAPPATLLRVGAVSGSCQQRLHQHLCFQRVRTSVTRS